MYKGRLPDGRVVAVKQLKAGGGQGEREFRAELESISRIHHRHLVSLVGYCISENQRLLIYDYVPNNTLSYHLHGELEFLASDFFLPSIVHHLKLCFFNYVPNKALDYHAHGELSPPCFRFFFFWSLILQHLELGFQLCAG